MYPVVTGDLAERSLGDVLLACQRVGFTGTIRVSTATANGYLGVRSGIVTEAEWLAYTGDAALDHLAKLVTGRFEIRQRLVGPDGQWCASTQFSSEVASQPLPALLDHCAAERMTGQIEVRCSSQSIAVRVQRGKITEVRVNEQPSHDRILRMIQFTTGTLTLTADPLDLGLANLPARPARIAAGTVAPSEDYLSAAPDDPTVVLLACPAADDDPLDDDLCEADFLGVVEGFQSVLQRPIFAASGAPAIAAPHGTKLTYLAPPSAWRGSLAAAALIALSVVGALWALQ